MRRFIALTLLHLALPAGAANLTVNTAVDEFGTGASCSLREAIQSANGNADFGGCVASGIYSPAITDIINLPTLAPGAAFTLTRFTGHDDANNSTDLDIAGNLTLNGVSAANTIIRGDTNDPDAERERLIHVISGNVLLRNMTLRDGRVDNQRAGGGLRTEPGSTTTLVNVVVGQNVADGNAGGILNRGTMVIRDSAITGNETLNAVDGGGGIFSSGTLTVEDSLIAANAANPADRPASGGGLLVADGASATITRTIIEGNRSSNGGGIHAEGELIVHFTTIRDNLAVNDVSSAGRGAGIACMAGVRCELSRTLVVANFTDSLGAGALSAGELSVVESIFQGNTGGNGGAIAVLDAGGTASTIVESSTIIGNIASNDGGAIWGNGQIAIVNSTLVGNNAADGGAVYTISASSGLSLRNTTLVANSAGTSGGGIRTSEGAVTSMGNSVLSGNTAPLGANCSGVVSSTGANLLGSTAGCTLVIGPGDPNLFNIDPQLLALADTPALVVGAPGATRLMPVQAPSPTSPLIDRGNSTGCRDEAGALLTTDQIGNPRALDGPDPDLVVRCDIGAIEFVQTVVVNAVFSDGFEPAP
jgi:CSLREA domain-containing protein